jgi:nicotinamide mononucleotide (NMN) deamidase PncC
LQTGWRAEKVFAQPELEASDDTGIAASGGTDRGAVEGPLRNDLGRRILDRRACFGGAAGVPGASAYFLGGAVVYTRQSRAALLGVTEAELTGITPSTEPYAMLFARKIRGQLTTSWSVGETGTAGPTGSRYGHAPGHSCIAICGRVERSITLETGKSDRFENMLLFADAALDLLEKCLG